MRKFRSAKEMARYFDRHGVTDRNSRPAKGVVNKQYDPTLTMRIPPADLLKLKKLADARGAPTATMGRMLLLERLRAIRLPVSPSD
jgi:predicted DNA binding CopG/RHH family protein